MRPRPSLRALLALLLLFAAARAYAHGGHGGGGGPREPRWYSMRKASAKEIPTDQLAALFPKARKVWAREIPFTKSQLEELEQRLGPLPEEDRELVLYELRAFGWRTLGSAFLFHVERPEGEIDIGLALSPEGKLLRVILFTHEGGTLDEQGLLTQFAGKSLDDPFQVGQDLEAPAGAEEEAQAIADAVRRRLLLAKTALRL